MNFSNSKNTLIIDVDFNFSSKLPIDMKKVDKTIEKLQNSFDKLKRQIRKLDRDIIIGVDDRASGTISNIMSSINRFDRKTFKATLKIDDLVSKPMKDLMNILIEFQKFKVGVGDSKFDFGGSFSGSSSIFNGNKNITYGSSSITKENSSITNGNLEKKKFHMSDEAINNSITVGKIGLDTVTNTIKNNDGYNKVLLQEGLPSTAKVADIVDDASAGLTGAAKSFSKATKFIGKADPIALGIGVYNISQADDKGEAVVEESLGYLGSTAAMMASAGTAAAIGTAIVPVFGTIAGALAGALFSVLASNVGYYGGKEVGKLINKGVNTYQEKKELAKAELPKINTKPIGLQWKEKEMAERYKNSKNLMYTGDDDDNKSLPKFIEPVDNWSTFKPFALEQREKSGLDKYMDSVISESSNNGDNWSKFKPFALEQREKSGLDNYMETVVQGNTNGKAGMGDIGGGILESLTVMFTPFIESVDLCTTSLGVFNTNLELANTVTSQLTLLGSSASIAAFKLSLIPFSTTTISTADTKEADSTDSSVYSANGRFVNNKILTWAGEEGPEVIIPLGSKRRTRGIDLWEKAGDMLGVKKHAKGGIIGTAAKYSINSSQSNQGSSTSSAPIQVNVGGITIDLKTQSNSNSLKEMLLSQKEEVMDVLSEFLASALGEAFENQPLVLEG